MKQMSSNTLSLVTAISMLAGEAAAQDAPTIRRDVAYDDEH